MKKLNELCFDSICENLDTYALAYNTSANEELIMNIEFLRRDYSSTILEKKYQMLYSFNNRRQQVKRVSEEHMDFLINKYVTELDTELLKNYPWDIIAKKFAEIGSGLKTLQFRDSGEWEEVVCHLPNLKDVYIDLCNRKFLRSVAEHCPKIESLTIVLTDDFKDLCGTEFELNNCLVLKKVTIETWKCVYFQPGVNLAKYLLQNLPNLEELEFDRFDLVFQNILKDNCGNLKSIKSCNLKVLNLMNVWTENPEFDDTFRVCATLCPRLKSVNTYIKNQENLNCVSKLAELQRLFIYKYGALPAVDLDKFLKENEKNLTFLKIKWFGIGSVTNLLRSCINLIELHLISIGILKFSNVYTPELYDLKLLHIEDLMEVDDFLIVKSINSLLRSAPNLEKLEIVGCEEVFSEIETCIIERCEQGQIKHIYLDTSAVKAKFVKDVLFSCSTLESISFVRQFYLRNVEDFESVALLLPNKPKILLIN